MKTLFNESESYMKRNTTIYSERSWMEVRNSAVVHLARSIYEAIKANNNDDLEEDVVMCFEATKPDEPAMILIAEGMDQLTVEISPNRIICRNDPLGVYFDENIYEYKKGFGGDKEPDLISRAALLIQDALGDVFGKKFDVKIA